MKVGYSETPARHCQKVKLTLCTESENLEPNFIKLEPDSSWIAEGGGGQIALWAVLETSKHVVGSYKKLVLEGLSTVSKGK